MIREFSKKEIPTYVGSLTGIRAMEVDAIGRIRSPSQHFIWQPGPNHAKCYRAEFTYDSSRQTRYLNEHKIASLHCSCGFYSYFHQKHADNYLPARNGVYAIVKAYGRVTYGEAGFRAEKMEILALINLQASTYKGGEPVPPKPPGRWPFIPVWLGIAVMAFCLVSALFRDAETWPWIGYALGAAALSLSFIKYQQYRVRKFFENFRVFARRRSDWLSNQMLPWAAGVSDQYVEICKRRYPDIPWYDSVEAALKEHPLSKKIHKE